MLFLTFCALTLTVTCLASPISDAEPLREYIKDIQRQIDDKVKPCENFGKYACGNLKPDETYKRRLEELIKDVTNNENPKTDDEKLIRTLYMSCKDGTDITKVLEQVDVLKSISAWPVTRDFSDEEIARLFGYLATLDMSGVLSIDFENLHENNKILLQLGSKHFANMEDMSATLEKYGATAEQSLKTVEEIDNFMKQLNDIRTDLTDKEYLKLNNVAALKEAVPNFDWDTYFTTFAKQFDANIEDMLTKSVETPIKQLQILVDVITATNSKTVVNYLIWRFVAMGLAVDCQKLESFLDPILIIQNIKADDDFKNFIMHELEMFSHFEKSFSDIKSQLNNPESKRLNEYIKVRKTVYENYEIYLSGKYYSKLFSNFKINEKTIYTNIINIMHAILKRIIVNKELGIFMAYADFIDFIQSPIPKYATIAGRPKAKTILNNFVTDNTDFWIRVFYVDDIYENRTISASCLPYENKNETYKNMNYVNSHAAYHIALQDYLHYVNEHKDEFKKHTEILTEAGLNHEKAFMLALAQEKCEDSESKDLEDDTNLLWFFKHSKQFSDTWGCAADDAMNKACDDSTFITNFEKS